MRLRRAPMQPSVLIPTVADGQLRRLLGASAIELDLDLASRSRGLNLARKLFGGDYRLAVKLGYQVSELKTREIRRTVVDDALNLKRPLFRPRNAAMAGHIS